MAEKHYRGGCQCGAVAYEVAVDIDAAIICNCSRCKPMGFVLAFAAREKFDLKSGADNLTEYLFNKKAIQHLFCKTCGVESFAYARCQMAIKWPRSMSTVWQASMPARSTRSRLTGKACK